MSQRRDKKPTEIVNKTVSFNLQDPDQQADFEFAGERSNFSSFVKFLIRQERLKHNAGQWPYLQQLVNTQPNEPPAPVKEEDGDVLSTTIANGDWM